MLLNNFKLKKIEFDNIKLEIKWDKNIKKFLTIKKI